MDRSPKLRINLLKDLYQRLFNIWSFVCLYILGTIYLVIEFNRRYQLFYKVRHLDVERDLPKNVKGSVCLITGGSRGIGLHVVKVLIQKGCRVIIASSTKRGRAQEQLAGRLSKLCNAEVGQLEIWHLDLESMDSVLSLVEKVQKNKIRLNILVNNAGIMFAPFKQTVDGFESHFAVNYLGHCLLTWCLMPVLRETSLRSGKCSRVVMVSSSTHFARGLRLDDLQGEDLYSPYHAYAQSKLAQIMFSYQMESYLNRQEQESLVHINCVHPGVALTELYEHVRWVKIFPWLAKQMFRSARAGAETVTFSALSDEMEGVGGKYLEDCAIIKSSKESYNKANQEQLWGTTWSLMEPWLKKADLKNPAVCAN